MFLIAATYVQPCSRSDPQINVCIKNSFNHLKPFLANGLPELAVPALEPLHIEQMSMENDAGAVRIKAQFSNILVKGASNYTVKEVRSDVSVIKKNRNFIISFKLCYIFKLFSLCIETSHRHASGYSTSGGTRQIRRFWQCFTLTSPVER